MHEILNALPAGALVLDLGSAQGSFRPEATSATTIRLDRQAVRGVDGALVVRADAALLPFADGSFQAIVSNHSLEHFEQLDDCLREIGRVIRPRGALFVSVPDALTMTDKLYRWLARGGGHVNRFTSPGELAGVIVRSTGLRHVATRTLYSSLSFLNRRNSPRPIPRRLLLLGGGYEWSLSLYVWASRRIDRWFHLRTSVYGWAMYFGEIAAPIDREAWLNVCVRCGSGIPAASLERRSRTYRCPHCGATNPFVR